MMRSQSSYIKRVLRSGLSCHHGLQASTEGIPKFQVAIWPRARQVSDYKAAAVQPPKNLFIDSCIFVGLLAVNNNEIIPKLIFNESLCNFLIEGINRVKIAVVRVEKSNGERLGPLNGFKNLKDVLHSFSDGYAVRVIDTVHPRMGVASGGAKQTGCF